jgi:hypothetical protein
MSTIKPIHDIQDIDDITSKQDPASIQSNIAPAEGDMNELGSGLDGQVGSYCSYIIVLCYLPLQ